MTTDPMTTDPGAEGIDELRERFAALLADRTGVDWDSLPPMATAGRLFEAGVILSEIGVLALIAERDRYRMLWDDALDAYNSLIAERDRYREVVEAAQRVDWESVDGSLEVTESSPREPERYRNDAAEQRANVVALVAALTALTPPTESDSRP